MEHIELQLANDAPGIGSAGQRVSLTLSPADVHDPSELPTYLAGYRPFGFRAEEACPVTLVERDEDKHRDFSSDDVFQPVVVKGSVQSPVNEVDPASTLSSYKTVERFLGAFIPEQTRINAGSNPNYDPAMAAMRRVRWGLDLDLEIDVFDLLGTNANWAASVRTAVAGGKEWDDASADPIKNLQTAIEKSFQPVTECWMNQKVAHAFLRADSVREHMRQMLGDQAAAGIVGSVAGAGARNVDFQIPGLPPIRVVASKKKSASSLAYVLGDVCVLTCTVPGGQPTSGEEIQSATLFRRRGPNGNGFSTREFFVENRGPLGGTMVVASVADVPKFTSTTAGGIITNVHT